MPGRTRCSRPARCRSRCPIRSPARRRSRRGSTSRASRASRRGRCRAWSRCSTRASTSPLRLARRPVRSAKPLPAHRDLSRSRTRTGCARRRRSSARSKSRDRLHIVPTWCEPPQHGVVIRLDPGLAFGTGSHPTTRLCLEWLLEQLHGGESVLDYGCGSGVLAIAAAKLGAASVDRHRRRSAGAGGEPRQRAGERRRCRVRRPGCAAGAGLRHRRREHPRESADPARARALRRACGRAVASRCRASWIRRPTPW